MTRTSRFIRPLLEFVFPTADEATLLLYHGIIRKLAHFTEYAILGFLAVRAFSRAAASFLSAHPFAHGMVLVVSVACLDEFNQSFNPARTGSPIDVLIDIAGGFTAISLACLFVKRRSAARDQVAAM